MALPMRCHHLKISRNFSTRHLTQRSSSTTLRTIARPLYLQRNSSIRPQQTSLTLSTRISQSYTFRPFGTTPPVLAPEPQPPDKPGTPSNQEKSPLDALKTGDLYDNIYTLPNLLTLSRIAACPLLGYYIVQGNFHYATAILLYAGVTDLVDGWMARTFKQTSVLGTILDPAADKLLMTVLAVTLAIRGLLPAPLAVLIIGRDVLLSLSAFIWRYTTLPPPKTFKRYWDFSIPSAEVHPTQISKYNTFLQLCLMGLTTIAPILPFDLSTGLTYLQWAVAASTIGSGLSYVFSKNAVKVLK